MRVQIFSDIHSDHAALEKAAAVDADLYICAGDLVNWSKGLEACGEILRPLGDRLWVIPGNHETSEQITQFCEDYGFRDFHCTSFEAAGYRFAGLGYSSPTPFDTPGEYSEDELRTKLAPFAALEPLVLICHAPPLNSELDRAGDGQHFGSAAVAEFVEANQPEYFFCGHIHEAAGVRTQIGKTQGANVGKAGYVLEL